MNKSIPFDKALQEFLMCIGSVHIERNIQCPLWTYQSNNTAIHSYTSTNLYPTSASTNPHTKCRHCTSMICHACFI